MPSFLLQRATSTDKHPVRQRIADNAQLRRYQTEIEVFSMKKTIVGLITGAIIGAIVGFFWFNMVSSFVGDGWNLEEYIQIRK